MESKDMPEIEVAVGAAWLWEKFGKEIAQSATGAIHKKWKSFKSQSAAEAYAQKMKKRYGIMQLWKMSAPTSVEQIYTRVNILKKQSAFQNIPKEKLEQIYLNQTGFGEVIESGKDGMTAVRDHDRLFILGKPGAGKTTFLKHVTLEAIAGKLEATPVFVQLRDFSESNLSLMKFILEQFDICGFPDALPFIETILKKGKAIVLFDGLDEVNREGGLRKKLIQSLKNFSEQYEKSKVVITCRVAASEYNFEGFTTVEMADFDDEQIKSFVTKWFANDLKTSEHFFREFEQQAGNRLRDLAKTPLLLTLLCLGFEDTRHFPNRRSEIYGEALDALLKRRDRADGIERDEIYQKLSLERKKQMFARIAAETFEKSNYLIKKSHLENKIEDCLKNLLSGEDAEDIDGNAVLKDIEAQHGIFVECAKGLYSFAHLSFQEYYTVQYIISQSDKRLSCLMNFFGDVRWREVFLLTAQILDDADVFFRLFIQKLDSFASKEARLSAILLQANHPFLKEREVSLFLILDVAFALILDPSFKFDKSLNVALFRAQEIGISFAHSHSKALNHMLSSILARTCAFARIGKSSLDFISISNKAEILACRWKSLSSNSSVLFFPISDSKFSVRLCGSITFWDADANSDMIISPRADIDELFIKALFLSQEKGYEECQRSLGKLSFPSEKTLDEEWNNFSDALYKTFKRTFCVEDYEFTKEEVEQVSKYLEATKLLFECLEVADVSDREAIEDQLLRPPKN